MSPSLGKMECQECFCITKQQRIMHLSLLLLLPAKLRMRMSQSCQYLAFLEKTMYQQRKCGIPWYRMATLTRKISVLVPVCLRLQGRSSVQLSRPQLG
uniref:Uncharacterized protein n=1 Tax=Arundo donax TaxID=35708 RepID=A0A0A9GYW8_ARUDO